ncbi:Toluene efflux pump outer membrane protein TtgI precursor [Pseudodesulfovibrio hydrargyri]|uniref:Toluene efflux pump outer membrane protein TtgI n=1 Tax=Pseudodesulfovibrio hydrargyri TaxID=2125990 RepID=A0A1J5MYW8_9BACT|nr:efflux transporter outer membrane subunit [Pseudodesulfovibrio hydrargyri]OIQ51709.1 Toluene efflux pump outer membrane protein TtgI precursor [Pseudodesulfovibrio hydrargyri]
MKGKMKKTAVPAALTLLAVLLAACSPFRPDARTDDAAPLPTAYTLYSDRPLETGKWWEALGNEELNGLVETALAANFDLEQAWARLRQAGAVAVQSSAGKYPTLDATGDYKHTRSYTKGARGGTITDETHSIGLEAGYELDLWGRVEAGARGGELDYRATREDLSASAMTVAGEVVSRWLEIQSQRRKERIIEEQIRTNQTYLELIELRFRNSISTALDVYQQRQNLAMVKALLPPVKSREQLLLNELALLMGKPAGSVTVAGAEVPQPEALPGLGLPADLLANRPDVRSAGLALSSADWGVAAARADRLPSLTMAGTGQFTGDQLGTLFDNWILTLAGAVVGPIFDGGYRKAEVDKARAVVDERLGAYKSTVYTAFKEVEDALAEETWQKRYLEALSAQLEASRVSLREAVSRYTQGLDDYLPVLSALMSVQDLEVTMVTERTNLMLYRVALYRALGGTWTDSLTDPSAAADKTIADDGTIESHDINSGIKG